MNPTNGKSPGTGHTGGSKTINTNPDFTPHAEAQRLLTLGFKLCALHPLSKRPVGKKWQLKLVTFIDPNAGGYGMPLAVNGLCSIDPDNVELAREGLQRCGFVLEDLMDAGVRTSSTRPGSGGRSTFHAPAEIAARLRWIKFSTKAGGTILELRAHSSNLQDCLPGTVYQTAKGEGPYAQHYANGRTFDEAPALPPELLNWWLGLSEDMEFSHQQQRLFCGPGVQLAVSVGGTLAFPSPSRMAYNAAHDVREILERNGYACAEGDRSGRLAPPTATGAPSVREIPGRSGLWQSDHASDPLHGTFDAWTANVVLEHGEDLSAAEAAWAPVHFAQAASGFTDVEELPNVPARLPAFSRDRSGGITASKNNIQIALRRSDFCGFHIRLDTFRGELMLTEDTTESWRAFQDTDYTALCLRLEGLSFRNISKESIRDAVAYQAKQAQFDSAQFWIRGLRWDGVARVPAFLVNYFGTSDTPYTRAVGMYIWTALAGRVMQPGVKCDMVPIAVGAQGMRKSSAVAALVPHPDYFGSIDLNAKDDDIARKIRCKLVLELDELRGLATRAAEHIKSLITRTHEEWTPKYMEMSVRYARRCLFFGTSNKNDFLADETGNRRWLPFNCGMCDPDAIARDRDQLWAEALVLFTKHGVAHREAEQLAQAEHAAFVEYDEWDDVVEAWLWLPDVTGRRPANRPLLTSREVLGGAFSLGDAQMGTAQASRVKKVLLRLGYTYEKPRVDGKRTRGFVPPSLF